MTPTTLDHNGFEVLSRDECLRLLTTVPLGRAAFVQDGRVSVLPVNFRVVDDEVVIGTGEGHLAAVLLSGAEVAFEADHFDGLNRAGWSVLVRGPARGRDLERYREALSGVAFARWRPRSVDRIIAITPTEVTGRRIVPSELPEG